MVEFIHGVSERDLKIDKDEYLRCVKQATEELEKEKTAKEEAAKQELADLLEMGTATTTTDEKSEISMSEKKKKKDKLGSLDKVYNEMKTKNKRLKKELAD